MHYEFSKEDNQFTLEVRNFVKENLPEKIKEKVKLGMRLEREDIQTWHSILEVRGWSTPNWPKEYGGPGWTPLQKYIFGEETLLGNAPRIVNSGVSLVGPMLIAFGTEEQRQRFLPGIKNSRTWWAQGYSEPDSGSDLASLRTKAYLDGDEFVVSGQKIWTSYCHFADMIFCLVKTNPEGKPQESISMLLIDAKSPGITIRPIKMLEGGKDLNAVFFDDVRVPVANLVGEVNKGWTYAKQTLSNERIGVAGVASCKQQIERARKLLKEYSLHDKSIYRTKLADLEIQTSALEFMAFKVLAAEKEDVLFKIGPSMLKVRGTELRQEIYAFLMSIAGDECVPFIENSFYSDYEDYIPVQRDSMSLAANYLDSRKLSIYAGANEVQRNLIAKVVFS